MKISAISFLIAEDAFTLYDLIAELAECQAVALARLLGPVGEGVVKIGHLNLPRQITLRIDELTHDVLADAVLGGGLLDYFRVGHFVSGVHVTLQTAKHP